MKGESKREITNTEHVPIVLRTKAKFCTIHIFQYVEPEYKLDYGRLQTSTFAILIDVVVNTKQFPII